MGLYRRGGKWWTAFTVGKTRHFLSTGLSDKRAAEEVANNLRREQERRSAGLLTAEHDHAAQPWNAQVGDFEAVLRGSGRSKAHMDDVLRHLRAFGAWAKARGISDLDDAKVSRWIADESEAGNLSVRSRNRRLAALKQFSRWATETARLPRNPLARLRLGRVDTDRRYERRALTAAEVARLSAVAASRPLQRLARGGKRPMLSAPEHARLEALGAWRSLLYRFAYGSGLRKGETGGLRWIDLDLDSLQLNIPAKVSKSRRDQSIPLRSDLAETLRAMRGAAEPTDPVFPRWAFPTHRTFQADLEAAGIAKVDKDGIHVDFHSLRVGMISALAAAGVHPREAQLLARHADVELTLSTYSDPRLLNVRGALARIAVPPAALSHGLSHSPDVSAPVLAATGTDGPVAPLAQTATEGGTEGQGRALRMAPRPGLEPGTYGLTVRDAASAEAQNMAPAAPSGVGLSHGLSHSTPNPTLSTDSRSLADALLAKAQEATDPATVRALVDAARALLARA